MNKENKSSFIESEKLLDHLWQARDVEIAHLWQRSIFLATFIVLLFTVFFTLYSDATSINIEIKSNVSYCVHANENGSKEVVEHDSVRDIIALVCIAEAGFILSVLWIAMARGSKTSYERIEDGINVFHDKCDDLIDDNIRAQKLSMWLDNLWNFNSKAIFPAHGALPVPKKVSFSFGLFSGIKTGSFVSLSKINTVIGYLFAFVWMLLISLSISLVNAEGSILFYFVVAAILIEILVNFFIAVGLFYLVTSDNTLKFWDYFHLIFNSNTVKSRKIWQKEEVDFIWSFFFDTDNSYHYRVLNPIVSILNTYNAKAYPSIGKLLINELTALYGKCGKNEHYEKSVINRIWQGFYDSKWTLEAALMYRECLHDRNIELMTVDNYIFLSLKDNGNNLIFTIDTLFFVDVLKITKRWTGEKHFHVGLNKNEKEDNYCRLYVDNNWEEVHKCAREEVLSCYPSDVLSSNIYHIVFDPNNLLIGLIRYIRMELIDMENNKYKLTFFDDKGYEVGSYSTVNIR